MEKAENELKEQEARAAAAAAGGGDGVYMGSEGNATIPIAGSGNSEVIFYGTIPPNLPTTETTPTETTNINPT